MPQPLRGRQAEPAPTMKTLSTIPRLSDTIPLGLKESGQIDSFSGRVTGAGGESYRRYAAWRIKRRNSRLTPWATIRRRHADPEDGIKIKNMIRIMTRINQRKSLISHLTSHEKAATYAQTVYDKQITI
jgi:hypothetical protein